jgi:hypothetical protein
MARCYRVVDDIVEHPASIDVDYIFGVDRGQSRCQALDCVARGDAAPQSRRRERLTLRQQLQELLALADCGRRPGPLRTRRDDATPTSTDLACVAATTGNHPAQKG